MGGIHSLHHMTLRKVQLRAQHLGPIIPAAKDGSVVVSRWMLGINGIRSP